MDKTRAGNFEAVISVELPTGEELLLFAAATVTPYVRTTYHSPAEGGEVEDLTFYWYVNSCTRGEELTDEQVEDLGINVEGVTQDLYETAAEDASDYEACRGDDAYDRMKDGEY